jgi:hypothetical protein
LHTQQIHTIGYIKLQNTRHIIAADRDKVLQHPAASGLACSKSVVAYSVTVEVVSMKEPKVGEREGERENCMHVVYNIMCIILICM